MLTEGVRITFRETVSDQRVLTIHGSVYEKYPLLDNKYVVYENNLQEGIVKLRNYDHPHHVIMWWLEWNGQDYIISNSNMVATYDVLLCI